MLGPELTPGQRRWNAVLDAGASETMWTRPAEAPAGTARTRPVPYGQAVRRTELGVPEAARRIGEAALSHA